MKNGRKLPATLKRRNEKNRRRDGASRFLNFAFSFPRKAFIGRRARLPTNHPYSCILSDAPRLKGRLSQKAATAACQANTISIPPFSPAQELAVPRFSSR